MNNIPTPDVVCKIYRQVLRYAGASVLYALPARLNLRALYRPEFDIWMKKAKLGKDAAVRDRQEWEEFSRRGECACLRACVSLHMLGLSDIACPRLVLTSYIRRTIACPCPI